MGRASACMGEMRNSYNILVGKHEGKRPHGRPRQRQEDNTSTHLKEMQCKVVDWIHLLNIVINP
jgi:hypothetical protein